MKLSSSFSCCYFVLLFCVFLTIFTKIDAAKKKCSRTINRIPVHKDFDMEKFTGTWYTISRTTWAWGDDTYDSFSIEFTKHEDDQYHYSYTGKMGDTCLPVESGVLEVRQRDGSYFMRGSGSKDDHVTLIVSFTDYKDMALVYYCYKYRPGSQGQCTQSGMQVEVISRTEKPAKAETNNYVKRANKRLCASTKHLNPTAPGLCKIPDILEAARQRNQGSKAQGLTAVGRNKCAVNNIPVQAKFNSAQLHGLWYEIARTRFTFNKMESVLNFHRFDETTGKIYSYYTGTVVTPSEDGVEVPCLPAIHGMSIVNKQAKYASDRMGRIGWDDSTYPWSPLKVLYADDEYILFYSCFSGPSEQQCPENMMEVTLLGRSRDITDEKRQSIFSILEDICVDSNDVMDTKFYANCSNWVTIETEKIKPEDCKLDDIPMFEDYDIEEMKGRWYQYGSINYNNMTSLDGIVMKKTVIGDVQMIQSKISAFGDDGKCITYHTSTRDMCIDSSDQITILPKGGDGKFVFNKVLYVDNTTLVEYTCSMRTAVGSCDRRGIQFNIYTKEDSSNHDSYDEIDVPKELIAKLTKSVCLDENDLIMTTEWCEPAGKNKKSKSKLDYDSLDADEDELDQAEETIEYVNDDADNNDDVSVEDDDSSEVFGDDCDIDRIATVADIDEYIQDQLYGYWYEIARSTGNEHLTRGQAVVAYFTSANNETLNIYYTGLSAEEPEEDAVCSDVIHSSLLARCTTDYSGDYLARFNVTDNFSSYVPFKVIYTDYINVLVTYTCQDMTEKGACSENGVHIRIWSRNATLSEDDLSYAYGMCLWACVDPVKDGYMQRTDVGNNACLTKLEDYVGENDLEPDYTDFTEGIDYAEPKDQRERDQFQLDLEAALLMDDEEFYSDGL